MRRRITKVFLSLLLLISIVSCKNNSDNQDVDLINSFQFADSDITYRPGDNGMIQYRSKSLYNSKQVVLTFDDGPHPINTPRLLDILKEKNVTATFFVLGSNAK